MAPKRKTKRNKKRVAKTAKAGTLVSGLRASFSMNPEIEMCLHKYAQLLVDPFRSEPTCLPHSPFLTTMSFRTHTKSTFVTGTAGVGYMVGQIDASFDVTTAGPLLLTTAGYTGGTSTVYGAASVAGETTTAGFSSPFADVTIGGGAGDIVVRHVCSAVRYRCTTPPLYLHGTVFTYVSLGGTSIGTFESPDSVRTRFEVKTHAPTREWTTFLVPPQISQTGTAGVSNPYAFQQANPLYSGSKLWAITQVGSPPSASHPTMEYEVEVINFFEAFGLPATNMSTPAYGDDAVTPRLIEYAKGISESAYRVLSTVSADGIERAANNLFRGIVTVAGLASRARSSRGLGMANHGRRPDPASIEYEML